MFRCVSIKTPLRVRGRNLHSDLFFHLSDLVDFLDYKGITMFFNELPNGPQSLPSSFPMKHDTRICLEGIVFYLFLFMDYKVLCHRTVIHYFFSKTGHLERGGN